MEKKRGINKRSMFLTLGVLLIVAAVLIPTIGQSRAKYRTQLVLANEVSYQNELAESFKLLDHPVVVQEDGSYVRDESDEAEPTSGFSFKLIPGITLPAAPYIEIIGKTDIPAYLYFEVVCPEGAPELKIAEDWTRLDNIAGKFGGTVYSYKDGEAIVKPEKAEETATTEETGASEEAEESADFTFDTFTVKTLSKIPMDFESGEVKVYAYMIRQVEGQTAAMAFEEAPAPTPNQGG